MKRKRQTLFELEQAVRGGAPRRVAAAGIFPRVRARAFDLGHPIDLRYGDAHAAPRNPVAHPAALSLDGGLPVPSSPDDAVLSYSVEPFDEEPEAGELPEPSRAAAVESWDRAEENGGEVSGAQLAEMASLEEDIQAILSQYQGTEGGEEPVSAPAPPEREPEPSAAPPPTEHPHAVFDQIARNLAFATTYTLPPVALERRFDEFDRIMDLDGAPSAPPAQAADGSGALSLDEKDLAGDLAAIRVLAPKPGLSPAAPEAAEAAEGAATELPVELRESPETPGSAG